MRRLLGTCGAGTVLLIFSLGLLAQQISPATRISGPIDEARLAVLSGNTHPSVRSQFERGPALPDLPSSHMLLVLKRSPQQDGALRTFLDSQQDRNSPNYHAWLTPDQFGQQFGPSDQDVLTITSWLTSHAFQVDRVSRGRTIIEFSGTAGQIQGAFHTEIRKYRVNGNDYWANSTDPAIPVALAPVVAGIVSLHNFPKKPLHYIPASSTGRKHFASSTYSPLLPNPLFDRSGGCGLNGTVCYDVSPYDLATIYNILPLWNASTPIDGTGQHIAIVGQSDIYPPDVDDFHASFGLPPPHVNIIHNGADPGYRAQTDETESDLDVEWASSIAKGATIDLVVSASTNTTAGVDLSAEYIVENNLAPVLSESYGACELEMGRAGNLFYQQLWQQAAAQGITVFVSTGDSGSAVCDQNAPNVTQGLSVNGIASTPYNVAVGGTDFNDLQNPSAYWNPLSAQDPTTQLSVKSYIPEMAWNNTCTNSEFFQFTSKTDAESDCNYNSSVFSPAFLAPVAGSGGMSNCTAPTGTSSSTCSGGYAK